VRSTNRNCVLRETQLRGRGLTRQHATGRAPVPLTAEQVVENAARGNSACRETLRVFCSIYGCETDRHVRR